MMIEQTKRRSILPLCVLMESSLFLAFLISPILQYSIYSLFQRLFNEKVGFVKEVYHTWREGIIDFSSGRIVLMELLTITFFILGMRFVLKKEEYYALLFKYRYVIAIFVLIVIVMNKLNGDSFAVYDILGGIQKDYQTDTTYPFFGQVRAIRSDEYMVSNALVLQAMINGTYYINKGILGVATNPFLLVQWFLSFLGIEYEYSFYWYFKQVLALLISFEFFRILTKDNRRISVLCTLMIYLSAFYLWWGFPPQIYATQGALVGLYYFIRSEKKVYRVLWLYIIGCFAYAYASNLYPAWQVPIAYISIAIAIWIIVDNIDYIKRFTFFDKTIIVLAIIFVIAGGLFFVYSSMDYIEKISNSVYPGMRYDYGGSNAGWVFMKLFSYIPGTLFAYKDFVSPNACEIASIISFFPIPTLLIWWQCWKNREKKNNLLVYLLSAVGIFIFIYCVLGLPEVVATISLMRYSTSARAVDMIGYIQVIFIAIYISRECVYRESIIENESRKKQVIRIIVAVVFVALIIWRTVVFHRDTSYLALKDILILDVLFGLVIVMLLFIHYEKLYRLFVILGAIICICTGLYVRPISIGLDSLYAKPVADEIQELVSGDDSKWIAIGGDSYSSFATLNGADTINMVNTVPNIELWSKVDKNGIYQEVYNRYAHVSIDFTEEDTSFELVVLDAMVVHLSYDDISKLDVKYIFSNQALLYNSKEIEFKQIYVEDGAYIYEVVYK